MLRLLFRRMVPFFYSGNNIWSSAYFLATFLNIAFKYFLLLKSYIFKLYFNLLRLTTVSKYIILRNECILASQFFKESMLPSTQDWRDADNKPSKGKGRKRFWIKQLAAPLPSQILAPPKGKELVSLSESIVYKEVIAVSVHTVLRIQVKNDDKKNWRNKTVEKKNRKKRRGTNRTVTKFNNNTIIHK